MVDAPPEFSVVVPTHDRPARLRACLEGIAAQAFDLDRVEVIVVNDGGAPGIDAALGELAEVLSLTVIDMPRSGPGAARNAGAARARGRFLAFIDDDCVPDRAWLATLAGHANEDDRRLLGGRVVNALAQNAYSDASERITNYVYDRSLAQGAAEQFFTTNNLAVRTDLFRDCGGFTTAIPSRTAEDKEFCDRWRACGLPLAHAPEAVVHHAHELTFRRFLRQHFNYGRGLLAFRLLRPRPGRIVPEGPGFYLKLITSPLPEGRLRASLLVAVAQLATTAGAAYQFLRWPLDHPKDHGRGIPPSDRGAAAGSAPTDRGTHHRHDVTE